MRKTHAKHWPLPKDSDSDAKMESIIKNLEIYSEAKKKKSI